MMAAAQPFLSGAISKTVNMPEATPRPRTSSEAYFEGWKLGLKALAIYRDGSQAPSRSRRARRRTPRRQADEPQPRAGQRRRAALRLTGEPKPLPAPPAGMSAHAITHKFTGRRPRGLHHRRPLPRRPARRDLHHDGQGRLDGRRPDGRARHDDLDRRCSTACRCATSSTSSRTSGSSRRASPTTPRSRSPSRSSTTSSAGSAPASCTGDDRAVLGLVDRTVTDEHGAYAGGFSYDAAAVSRLAAEANPGTRSLGRPDHERHRSGPSPAGGNSSPARDTAGDAASSTPGPRRPAAHRAAPRTADVRRLTTSIVVHSAPGRGSGGSAGGQRPCQRAHERPFKGQWRGTGMRALTMNLGAGGPAAFRVQGDAPSCAECGAIMVRNGSCYKCLNCGSTSGCS